MQSTASTVVVLGTGGTIAGTAADAADNVGYTAAQLGVTQLVRPVPALAGQSLETEQVAQLDSKDMDHATWLRLAQRVVHHLARDEVQGVVITHGTDTMEETAYFLQRVLAPTKPVVITGAMRPATALQSDGPQNLIDAVTVARTATSRGVVVVFAGRLHDPRDVRKMHSYQLDAFTSGDAGPLGMIEEGRLRMFRAWPECMALGIDVLPHDTSSWPKVALLTSHAGADGAVVRALRAAGVNGVVVAGTGNGTLHRELESALLEAQSEGMQVLRSTRCANGHVIGAPSDDPLAAAADLTPVKARVELMFRMLDVTQQGRDSASC